MQQQAAQPHAPCSKTGWQSVRASQSLSESSEQAGGGGGQGSAGHDGPGSPGFKQPANALPPLQSGQ
jgi:hypothetical protein